jgi:hypothetical protein
MRAYGQYAQRAGFPLPHDFFIMLTAKFFGQFEKGFAPWKKRNTGCALQIDVGSRTPCQYEQRIDKRFSLHRGLFEKRESWFRSDKAATKNGGKGKAEPRCWVVNAGPSCTARSTVVF